MTDRTRHLTSVPADHTTAVAAAALSDTDLQALGNDVAKRLRTQVRVALSSAVASAGHDGFLGVYTERQLRLIAADATVAAVAWQAVQAEATRLLEVIEQLNRPTRGGRR